MSFIAEAIEALFPGKKNFIDFALQDDSDGKGPYVSRWDIEDKKLSKKAIQDAEEKIKNSKEKS